MNAPESKQAIDNALRAFAKVPLKQVALGLFCALGYESEKTLDLKPGNLKGFPMSRPRNNSKS